MADINRPPSETTRHFRNPIYMVGSSNTRFAVTGGKGGVLPAALSASASGAQRLDRVGDLSRSEGTGGEGKRGVCFPWGRAASGIVGLGLWGLATRPRGGPLAVRGNRGRGKEGGL